MNIELSSPHSKVIYGGICAVIPLLFIFAPSKMNPIQFKSAKKILSIQAARKEPPRIAFESLTTSTQLKNEEGRFERTINLNEREFGQTKNAVKELRTRKIALRQMVISREVAVNSVEDTSWINDLQPTQKRILAKANERSGVLDQDWRIPSWRDLLAGEVDKANKAAVQSETPDRVYVSAEKPDGTIVTPEAIHTAKVEVGSSTRTIAGRIEVSPGLPVADGYFDVRHVSGGIATAAGTVNMQKGEYAINVGDNNGTIIASLYDRNGQKQGEGQIRISKGDALNQYSVKVLPIVNQASLMAVDFNRREASNNKNRYEDRGAVNVATYWATYNSESKSDTSGISKLNDVTKGSWMVARSESKAYYPSVHLLQAGRSENQSQTPVFRKSLVEALISIADDQALVSDAPRNNSIVWGQVLQAGKPQAGVEIGVEHQEYYQIVYFNALLIPDPKLTSTSENGYFAVLHLPEGFHSLVARRGTQYFGHINTVAEPETISYVEVANTAVVEKTEVRVFDAFSGAASEAEIEMQSLQNSLQVNGEAEVFLPQVDRLSFMNVNPLDRSYLQTQGVYTDTQDTIYAPLISAAWVQNIKAEHKITSAPYVSDIVGFVQEGDYEVFLSHVENFAPENIIYFDAQGNTTASSVPGGGFIMTQVPPGTHSVVLLSKQSKMMSSQVLPVDLGITTVLRF